MRLDRSRLTAFALLFVCCKPRVAPSRTSDWSRALPGHAVGDTAPAPQLRYLAPTGCPLAYEWTATIHMEPDARMRAQGMPTQGLSLRGRIEGEAPGDQWSLSVVWQEGGHLLVAGNVRLPTAHVTERGAATLLRTDGRSWREEDGPTTIWSANGTFSGLVRFFPTLPSGAALGASTPWRYRAHAQNAGVGADVRRGGLQLPAGVEVPPPTGEDFTATSRVARWITVDQQPVAVIETSETARNGGSQEIPGAGSMRVESARRSNGEHLVLATQGRLLFARYDDVITVHTVVGSTVMDQRQTVHAELSLVRACNGPVLSSPITPRTAVERTLDTYTTLRNAAASGQRAEMLSALSPSLRQRHGDDALASTLQRFAERHGPQCLGTPEIIYDAPRTLADGARRVTMSGGCAHAGERNARLTSSITAEVEGAGDHATVRRIAISSVQGLEDTNPDLLNLTPEVLRSDLDGASEAPAQ